MSALSSLPPEYQLARAIDLRQQPRLLLELNLVGLGLLLLSGWLFLWLAVRLRPEAGLRLSLRLSDSLVVVLGIVIAFAAVLLLHELVHGTCFWLITRRPPRFGVQLAYAYAAAPQWYIPRNPYLIVGMAPLVVITLVGVALLPVLPAALLLPWIFALTINASGSIGDLYIIAWLLTRPASALVNDHGDRIYIYLPEAR